MLTGDIEPQRRIQGHVHVDPFSYLEQDTPQFRTTVLEEYKRWKSAAKPELQQWRDEYKKIFEEALPTTEEYAHVKTPNYQVQYTYSHALNVWTQHRIHRDIAFFEPTSTDIYGIVEDIGDGSELYECSVYDGKQKLYSISPVGPTIAIQGNYLYFTTPVQRLRYNRVKRVNLKTGKQTKTLYIETNPKFNIELIKPPYQEGVFIKSTNALHQKLDIVEGDKPRRLVQKRNQSVFPCTADLFLTNTHLEPLSKLPINHYGVSAIQYQDLIYVITVSDAHHTCWKFQDSTFHKIIEAPQLRFLPHALTPSLLVSQLNKPSEVFEMSSNKITLQLPELLKLQTEFHSVRSVPYYITYESKTNTKPTALIVSAYGAYGIESQREYPIRWLPWLQRGWALVTAAPRGGRDKGDQWYDEGRTAPRKHTTFDDTVAVMRAAQKRLHIQPQKTIAYGRSAGGWTASMMALQHSNLVAGIIAEVPYVDVLRTTSNPKLPLTTLEYDEFGDPLHSKEDYKALLRISPVDLARQAAPNNCRVLLKTALHDSEVATYESLKLAAALRKNGWSNVFVSIDEDGGHFVGRDKMAAQFAEDGAYYSDLINLSLRSRIRTRKASFHKSKGTTRRASNSRKHVIRTATSASAE